MSKRSSLSGRRLGLGSFIILLGSFGCAGAASEEEPVDGAGLTVAAADPATSSVEGIAVATGSGPVLVQFTWEGPRHMVDVYSCDEPGNSWKCEEGIVGCGNAVVGDQLASDAYDSHEWIVSSPELDPPLDHPQATLPEPLVYGGFDRAETTADEATALEAGKRYRVVVWKYPEAYECEYQCGGLDVPDAAEFVVAEDGSVTFQELEVERCS